MMQQRRSVSKDEPLLPRSRPSFSKRATNGGKLPHGRGRKGTGLLFIAAISVPLVIGFYMICNIMIRSFRLSSKSTSAASLVSNEESKSLKDTLAAEIAKASGQTEKEMIALKEKVGAININDIASQNKDEWDNIRIDLESLKEDLREKQLLKLEDTDKELAKVRSTIVAINEEQETKNNTKFEELRKEMFALREDLAPKPKEKKRGLGLMKLFTSRLRRSSVSRAKVSDKVDGKVDLPVAARDVEPDEVAKILPPSVNASDAKKSDANTYSEDNSSDDEAVAPPAIKAKRSNEQRTIITSTSKEMEVTLALHRNYSYAAEQEKLNQETVNAAAVQALPSFPVTNRAAAYSQKKMLPSAMRRVRSMDPNAKSVTIDPYEIVRSWSKATIQPTGEVELEPVIEEQ